VEQIRESVRLMEEMTLNEPVLEPQQTVKSARSVRSEVSSAAKEPVISAPAASTSTPAVVMNQEPLMAVKDIDINNMPTVQLPPLLNQTFESDEYTDMKFPLRDREFVEAFVRIIAEASSRKLGSGVSGSGLFDNVYRMLAETVSELVT
jgi:hypothetical protein